MLRKSYYSTLGVGPNESANGIRQAFREVVKRYHPDRVGLERAGFFREILEAYHVLADPERRKSYDHGLYHAATKSAPEARPVPMGVRAPSELPLAESGLRTLYIKNSPLEAAFAAAGGIL